MNDQEPKVQGLEEEFARPINIFLRDAKETRHCLRMIATADPTANDEARPL